MTVQSRAETVPLFHHAIAEGANARPSAAVEANVQRILCQKCRKRERRSGAVARLALGEGGWGWFAV